MLKLYLKSMLIKYMFIIYFLFFFSFFVSAETDQNIKKLNVPNGFEITLYADGVISPRQITETNDGFIIVGSKSGDKILALYDKDKDGFAEEKIIIVSGLKTLQELPIIIKICICRN